MIKGYCGFDCSICPTYLAWKNDDDELREKLKLKYSTPDNPLEKSDYNCSGCCSEEGIFFVHCFKCEIRKKGEKNKNS
jgi:hypothetical protein